MESSRPEYWSGWPFPSPGDLPNPRIKPESSTLQTNSLPAEPQGSPRILEWVADPFTVDLPDPGIELWSPALQADSLPTEPQGRMGLAEDKDLGVIWVKGDIRC